MTQHTPDARAVILAKAIHDRHQPEITILFGSRARGDHKEGRSDIDIMLVQDEVPDQQEQARVHCVAESTVTGLYNQPPPVQIIWKTSEEFARKRWAVNHIVPNALREGVIMLRNPDEYNSRYQPGGDVDYQEEWNTTDERVRRATNHITAFNDMVGLGRDDDMIGLHAHNAMEHALKALVSATGHRYERIHNINLLMNDAMESDPGFKPRPALDGHIYNQYAGTREYYTKHTPITSIEGCQDMVNNAVAEILIRVQEVKAERTQWCL